MKYSLLDLVQNVASSMDSDEVNSIGDSTESMQIANIIRNVYFDIITRANLPEHSSLINLNSANDVTKPTLMYLPDQIAEIRWVKYNKMFPTQQFPSHQHWVNTDIIPSPPGTNPDILTMADIDYLPLRDFLNRMYGLSTQDAFIGSYTITVGPDVIPILYRSDKQPDFYTTFDDRTLVFDSYDQTFENALQRDNSLCYGRLKIPFDMTDSFVPVMDDDVFPLLLNEAKTLAWAELKQTNHSIADRNSKRGWTHTQVRKRAIGYPMEGFNELPYYGKR